MNNKITYRKEGDYLISNLTIENSNEDLKCCNQMQWVQAMNNIKNRAEEFVLNEIIYV